MNEDELYVSPPIYYLRKDITSRTQVTQESADAVKRAIEYINRYGNPPKPDIERMVWGRD